MGAIYSVGKTGLRAQAPSHRRMYVLPLERYPLKGCIWMGWWEAAAQNPKIDTTMLLSVWLSLHKSFCCSFSNLPKERCFSPACFNPKSGPAWSDQAAEPSIPVVQLSALQSFLEVLYKQYLPGMAATLLISPCQPLHHACKFK